MRYKDALFKMLEYAHKKFAEATRMSYYQELLFFTRYLKRQPSKAKRFDALGYYEFLQKCKSCHDGRPLASKTIKRKILSLYSIYEDGVALEVVKENPFDRVAKFAREIKITLKRPPRMVPFEEVSSTIKDLDSPRLRAKMSILFGGGLRVSELVALKTEDVKELGEYIGLNVTTAKTNIPRAVTLPLWASKYVRAYIATHKGLYLFPSPNTGGLKPVTRKWVSNLCYKIFGCRAHSARHTHISYLLAKGLPLADIAKSVGHQSITSTMLYDRRILDFESSVSREADYKTLKKTVVTS